ncbi:hypothetical protein HCN44_007179 [Aphidius gifuensis]|uniref:PKS/mFAS DH domain-containing protein n=1 Tax=Aphidius gifuensis TaxID=684658 RepID=A0A834XP43_APHGI|nr:hypothetical protein HCN44_007179 [Aphidius gifuensis]
MGEVGCAYADNTITAEQMILAIYYRGVASINNRTIEGSMAVIGLGHQDAKKYCSNDVEIACHNGAKSTTISGSAISIQKIVTKLNDLNIFAREVECGKIAYHSSYVTEASTKLLKYLEKIIPEPKKRSSKWLSTCFHQNEWATPTAQLASAEYFTKNFTSPVLFEETCTLIPDDAITIEISPHGILQTVLRTSLNSSVINMSLAQRGQDNIQVFLDCIGKLYCAGIQSKISNLYPSVSLPVSRGTPMLSPLIKWQHSDDHFVVSFDNEKNIISHKRTIEVSLKDQDFKYMTGHVVDGINSFPTTFYFVFIWQTLCMMQGKSFFDTSIVFKDIKFLKTIILPESRPINITIFIDKDNSQRKSKRSIIKPTRFREDDSSDDEPAPKKKNTSASRVDKVHLKKRSGSSRQAQYYHRQKALKSYHQAFPYDVLFRGFQDVNIQDNTSASKKSFTESAEDEEQEEENTVPDNSNDDTEHYFNANYSMKDDSHYSNLQSKDSSEDFVSTTSSDDKKQLRTHDGMLSSSKAHETKTVVHGIKGVSALAIIPGMKLDTGLPVDALHALWIGAVKQHTTQKFFVYGRLVCKNQNGQGLKIFMTQSMKFY